MNFSADQNLFSFKLGGTDAFGLAHEKQTFVDGNQTITTYKFGFLKITNVFKKYGITAPWNGLIILKTRERKTLP